MHDVKGKRTFAVTIIARIVFCEVIAVVILSLYSYRFSAPFAKDALINHLATPAHWIVEGWFTMIPPWFKPPETSYNPLLAETFYGLLMIPWKSEIVAKFLQVPFLAMSGWCVYSITTSLGCRREFALVSAAGLLSFRPFIRQALIGYNDIIFTSFFLLIVVSITRLHFSSRKERCILLFALASGLLTSTKYLALVYIPALLFAFGVIFSMQRRYFRNVRRRKKICLLIMSMVLLAAGTPTYIRNFTLTHNPFYPADVNLAGINIFRGMFDPSSFSPEYSPASLLQLLVGNNRTFAMPASSAIFLSGCLILVFFLSALTFRKSLRDGYALLTILFLIPGISLLLLLCKTPYSDERFMYPLFGLMWVYPAVLFSKIAKAGERNSILFASLFSFAVIVSTHETFTGGGLVFLRPKTLTLAAAIYVTVYSLFRNLSGWRRLVLIYCSIIFPLVAIVGMYVRWPHYENICRIWRKRSYVYGHGNLGIAWNWLDDATKENPSVICYTGSYMLYPLYGSKLQNRVIYAHIGPGNFSYLHEYGAHLLRDGTHMYYLTEALYRGKRDFNSWLENIRMFHCDYLFAVRASAQDELPVEVRWAMQNPELFSLSFQKPGVWIFKCNKMKTANHSSYNFPLAKAKERCYNFAQEL